MKKMLVVYYSWSNGNTKRIAEKLASETGTDIASFETTTPYKGSYEEVVDQGKREVEAGFMPEINSLPVNISDYEAIAIGTPTWWYTMAPAVLTFLTTHDFKGKTVIPFCTAASSGIGDSGNLLEKMAGTGDWKDGERFHGGASESDIRSWVEGLGL